MDRLRYKIISLLFGLLLGLALAEVMLRATGMGFGNSPMEPDPYLHHVHPRNYKFVQQHPSGELGGFEIEYNAEGRVFAGGGAKPPESPQCRVALMGDSFTEGGQVPYTKTFAGLLESYTGQKCEVRNYGVRSYAPAIYLVQWTRDVQPWKPDAAFVLLFGGDVREDVSYLAGAEMGADGFPTAIKGPASGRLLSTLRQSYVARFARMISMRADWIWTHYGEEQWTVGGVVEEHPEWGGPTPGLLIEMNRRARESGSRLVLMVVPSRYRLMGDGKIPLTNDFHQTVKQFAADNQIEFLDLFTPFERESKNGAPLFFLQDIHFNEAGHKVTAQAIADAYPQYFGAR